LLNLSNEIDSTLNNRRCIEKFSETGKYLFLELFLEFAIDLKPCHKIS